MSGIENGYVDTETLPAVDDIDEHDVQIGDRRTKPAYPTHGPDGPDGESWHDYFRSLRLARLAGDDDVPETTREVVSVDLSPEEVGLGRGVVSVLKALRAADVPRLELHRSVVSVSDDYYKSDAKKAPGEEVPKYRRGDLKKPAHNETHWWLHAAEPVIGIAMRIEWTEGVTPKGGRSFTFRSAFATDPLGIQTEHFYDYEPSGDDLKPTENEPPASYDARVNRLRGRAETRDRNYNDGRSWLDRRPVFTAFADFDAWLSEAVSLIQSAHEKLAARAAAA